MTGTHLHGDQRRDAAVDRKPLSLVLLISALAILAACGLTLIAPNAQTAILGSALEPHPASCAGVTPDRARLACYDALDADALKPPAKGAIAPLGHIATQESVR